MATITVVIIEDEKPARDLVKNYLSAYDKVELVGEFDNGFTGLKGINELKPHAVFLDVQMPKLTGFEMLELLEYQPEIVFTTAYDQFAIDAFERNAVDYLLKPFSKDRFNEAMQKLFERIEKTKGQDDPINRIKQHIEDSSDTIHRVVIKKSGKIHVISTEKIDYIEAQDDYVMIYSGEGRFLKQQTMKYFEKHLDNEMFMRVHRSYIVNVQSIDRIEPYEKTNYIISLKSGGKVPVSRNGMQGLKEKLDF